jgi:hypothetical protein
MTHVSAWKEPENCLERRRIKTTYDESLGYLNPIRIFEKWHQGEVDRNWGQLPAENSTGTMGIFAGLGVVELNC